MIREEQLSEVLSELARTIVTDFPIQGILDRLVERIVDVLPVSAAGVTLISPGTDPHYLAASSDGALQLEKLQTTLGHGPCVDAYQLGEAVAVPDLQANERYSDFSQVAADAGVHAVFAFPLRHNDGQLGALDLFRDVPGALDARDMAAAQTLADVAAAYVLNAQARQEALEATERFRDSSLHDALTGLPNRLLLQQRLEHAAERAQRSHAAAAVLFADLDAFKQVNDTYGHPVGDALLVAVADRLAARVRPGDTLARVSGDEFVVLCEDLHDSSDVEALAMRLDQAFNEPFTLPDTGSPALQLSVTASVGIAFAGSAEEIDHRLVADADAAMYQAKRKGGAAHQVIDLREVDRAADRVELQQDLRKAFARDELFLVYQPIVRADNGLVTGVEALLRWTHPRRGPIPPLTMVAIAEQSSLILEIGAWVLQRACTDRARWLALRLDRPLDLAVNVSARQLMAPGFCEMITEVLLATDMDPAALVLEMTEGIFLDDSARVVTVLGDLKKRDVRLALDDFGTGYSSLSYLRQFPVDIVKIDRGFVADIGYPATGGAILGAVTNLAHVLGMTVTAEGVETVQQHDGVAAMGCESAQGFYFARPRTADQITALLRTESTGALYLPPRAVAA